MPKSVRYIQMLPLERRAEELGQGFWLSVALALPDARLRMLQRQTLFHFLAEILESRLKKPRQKPSNDSTLILHTTQSLCIF